MRRVALLAVLLAGPALASTDAAMREGLVQASKACLKASDLKRATVVGGPILFSDANGKTALLIGGRWRPTHMKGAQATMLCLYDRSSGVAEIQEALRWGVAKP